MDIFDQATELEELHRDQAIKNASNTSREAESTGKCLYCNAPVKKEARWCGAECRDDWEFEQMSKRMR